MSIVYWQISKVDLDARAGLSGFDADGIGENFVQYENYNHCRKSPVASLGLGAVTKVILKCQAGTKVKEVTKSVDFSVDHDGSDMRDVTTGYYPGAESPFTHTEILEIVRDVNRHYFDPEAEA